MLRVQWYSFTPPHWYTFTPPLTSRQSSPLSARVAVSVAVKIHYRQYPDSKYLSLRRTRLNHSLV